MLEWLAAPMQVRIVYGYILKDVNKVMQQNNADVWKILSRVESKVKNSLNKRDQYICVARDSSTPIIKKG